MTTGVSGRLAAVSLFSLFLRQSSLQAHSRLLGRTAQSTRLGIATAMARTLSECQHEGSRGTCESTLALAIQTTTPFRLDLRPRGDVRVDAGPGHSDDDAVLARSPSAGVAPSPSDTRRARGEQRRDGSGWPRPWTTLALGIQTTTPFLLDLR